MTPKQQRFVQEYLIDLNATQAAIRAGYSKRSAYMTGGRMMKNDEVMAAISEAQSKAAERHEITFERVAQMMQEDREFARSLDQPGAAATASMNLAKLHGLIIDKHHHTGNPLAGLYERVTQAKAKPKPNGKANGSANGAGTHQ